jgi:hypothetical protein
MKCSSIWPIYPTLSRIQRWTEEETANDHDWPESRFFLKCCKGYIFHIKKKPDPSNPNGQMLEGGEEHNISRNPARSNGEIQRYGHLSFCFQSILSLSLSLSFGHPWYFLYNFAIYIAILSIFTKTPLCQVWVPFSFNQMPFLSLLLKYHVKNLFLKFLF